MQALTTALGTMYSPSGKYAVARQLTEKGRIVIQVLLVVEILYEMKDEEFPLPSHLQFHSL